MTELPLIESVAFDAPNPQSDGQGGTEDGWVEDTYVCRAHFLYLRGGEAVLQGRLAGKQPVVVTIWSSAGSRAIAPSWRMRDRRRNYQYNVRSIVPTDDRLYLELTCERGVPI